MNGINRMVSDTLGNRIKMDFCIVIRYNTKIHWNNSGGIIYAHLCNCKFALIPIISLCSLTFGKINHLSNGNIYSVLYKIIK